MNRGFQSFTTTLQQLYKVSGCKANYTTSIKLRGGRQTKCKMSPFRQTFGLPPSPEGDGIEAPTLGGLPEGEGIEAPSLGGAVKIEDFD